MKRVLYILMAMVLLTGTMTTVLPQILSAAGPNLIANPSAESVTGDLPTGWTKSQWGTNTSELTHKTGGNTGTRSLEVTVSARTDGDAKWMHDAVSVSPDTVYTYTSWYRTGAASEIDLQYTDASGVVSYAYVAAVTPNTAGGQLSVTFKTPTNVSKVSVMHVMTGIGTLEIDDVSLNSADIPPVEKENYVSNGTFETANGSDPANWNKNSWGNLTSTFKYDTTGRTGRSATTTVSNYVNGDAKWYADAVEVTAGKNYLYRDFYKSTVNTRVVVAFQDANGNYSFQEIVGAIASPTTWSQYSQTFVAPAGAVKASVYHVLSANGTLSIDDVSLYVALPTSGESSIANPSAETPGATTSMPAGWNKSSWGTNTATHTYQNGGRTGTKSLRVDIANHVDGDAKWYFEPIKLEAGKQYRFTGYYKTNATPYAVAMNIMADGSERYYTMPVARPAANSTTVWQKYSDTFSVPEGAVKTSAFMMIKQNGWLQTDDYELSSYSPNGFKRPLLTMTFDDGHEDNATTALPLLNQYRFKTTQCFATSFIEGQSQAVKNKVLAFKNSGHEICSHTVTHPFLTSKTGANLTYEVQHSKQYLKTLTGQPVNNFASPYGDYDGRVVNELKKYYRSHRSVDAGYNSKDNFDIYNIRVQNVLDTTSAAQITTWIEQAKADRTWLVLVYHRVASNPGPYDSYTTEFKKHLDAIKASGITVTTYNNALNETTAQLP